MQMQVIIGNNKPCETTLSKLTQLGFILEDSGLNSEASHSRYSIKQTIYHEDTKLAHVINNANNDISTTNVNFKGTLIFSVYHRLNPHNNPYRRFFADSEKMSDMVQALTLEKIKLDKQLA